MLYYNFRNFEEFKERFGIQHHGNGAKSRKNKILLSYIKNPRLLREAVTTGDYHLLHISSMAELKQTMMRHIRHSGVVQDELPYELNILGNYYGSSCYYTDEYNGLCEDGDYKSFRYVNAENERPFKMKIGKMFRKIILETSFGRTLSEQVITYLCEEMAQDWQSHAINRLPQHKLFVNDDFERIYNSDCLEGDFYSCMVDKGFHSFYEDAVDANAAYLENENGRIIARCVIFNQVKDQNSKIWRLAERQYSSGGSDVLKRALVDALIKGGHIDGYKKVGAGCNDTYAFLDNEGNSLSDLELSIECDLDYGDTLSYQDSFKNYDDYRRVATNYGEGDLQLDTTEGELEDEEREYDDYHECSCEEVTTVYYRGREMNCDSDRLEDFRWVEVEGEYHHEDDVSICDHCDEYYIPGNASGSDLTDEYYCCATCLERAETRYKEENWTYSEYDGEYFEDEDEVTEFLSWNQYLGKYIPRTISQESLDLRIECGDFHLIDDVAYDAIDTETGLPYSDNKHLDTISVEAA